MINLFNKIFGFLTEKACAAGLPDDWNPIPDCKNFSCIVAKIMPGLRDIALVIFTIMVFIGGYYLMTAGGSEEKIKKGKSTLLWAILGFAAILIAEGIRYIIEDLFK